ncbi:hypothetical protein EDD98_5815 [Streptomyces sp. PanSC19]|nr:hypothetical protein EDD98_5815 [Streptomyces sp. PanSC19]
MTTRRFRRTRRAARTAATRAARADGAEAAADLRAGTADPEPARAIPCPRRITTWITRHPDALTDSRRDRFGGILDACRDLNGLTPPHAVVDTDPPGHARHGPGAPRTFPVGPQAPLGSEYGW